MKKNIVAKLSLEDFNNNIVLNPVAANQTDASFGRIYYNFLDSNFYYFDCQKIYFRVPGEHSFPGDGDKQIIYDMEIQFRCHVLLYN